MPAKKEQRIKEKVGVYCRRCKKNWAELKPPSLYCTVCREELAIESNKKIEAQREEALSKSLPTVNTEPPKGNINTTLRSKEMWEGYMRYRNAQKSDDRCFFCAALSSGKISREMPGGWYIVQNDFPYDAVSGKHDMLFTQRHFSSESDMTTIEQAFFYAALETLNNEGVYDGIWRNFTNAQSEPQHFHLHLLQWKRTPEA